MKILLCCYLPLIKTYGGAKGYLEVAKNYRLKGHEVDVVGVDDIVGKDFPFMDEEWRVRNYPEKLRDYILTKGQEYDVVEFESIYLPFQFQEKLRCLTVARCSLLDIHLRNIKIPKPFSLRSLAGTLLKSRSRKKKLDFKIEQSLLTMKYCDLINVQNPTDKQALIEAGIDAEKIIVQPLGVFKERFDEFKKARHSVSRSLIKKIAFVGTFDNRKGAVEFPAIINALLNAYPDVEFKLLGALGMYPTEDAILNAIGGKYKSRIKVVGKFSPEELPGLLSDCSFGIFPSYLESFGYGVLEMMAAGLPVVGYNSPGINMLILPDLLVSPGKSADIIKTFSKLIEDKKYADHCSEMAFVKAEKFIYENQFNHSLERYQKIIGSRV